LEYLKANHRENDVVISRPGQAIPLGNDPAKPDGFAIAIPELNSLMTGFAGIKTYYGHWSETPFAPERRSEVVRDLFLEASTSKSSVRSLLERSGATYIIVPLGEFPRMLGVPPLDFYKQFGEVVVDGPAFALLRVTAS
jgi:hypothetical protein